MCVLLETKGTVAWIIDHHKTIGGHAKMTQIRVKNKQHNGNINWPPFWKEKSFLYTDIHTEQNHKRECSTMFLKRDYRNWCTQLLRTNYVLASVPCVGGTVIHYPHKVTALMKYIEFRSDYNKGSQRDDRRSNEPTQLQVQQGPLRKGHGHSAFRDKWTLAGKQGKVQ